MHTADSLGPDYWFERVTALCKFEVTNQRFGLSFLDLMSLDIATFEMIEKRVHELVKEQMDNQPKELKDLKAPNPKPRTN